MVAYANELQNDKAFRKVNVFFQSENLGPLRNGRFLIEKAQENYDTYIFTEDDNIFSCNLLSYLDGCLAEYKDEDDILCIAAYTDAFNAGKGLIVGYDTFIYRTHGIAGTISIGNNVIFLIIVHWIIQVI